MRAERIDDGILCLLVPKKTAPQKIEANYSDDLTAAADVLPMNFSSHQN
jgi:hypothetical protein